MKLSIIALAALLVPLVGSAQDAAPRARLSPSDIHTLVTSGPGAGSSGETGIETIVLKGDPAKPGLYAILLRVPARTTIQAHDPPDDRIATEVAGDWHIVFV